MLYQRVKDIMTDRERGQNARGRAGCNTHRGRTRLLVIGLSCLTVIPVFSQTETNTFPTSGNAGIGTTTPGALLTLYKNADTLSYLDHYNVSTGSNAGALIRLITQNSQNTGFGIVDMVKYRTGLFAIQNSDTNGAISIGTGGLPRLRISADGNVGIGTVTPGTSRLNVVGATSDNTSYGLIVQNSSSAPLIYARNDGNVGIGTAAPQYKLAVNGTIGTTEVIVTNTGWADYVFKPDYRLMPLTDVAAYIKAHQHLPEVPSAADVREKGVSVGEMQSKLLAKIEELTLHMIDSSERTARLERQNQDLRERNSVLQERVERLERLGRQGN